MTRVGVRRSCHAESRLVLCQIMVSHDISRKVYIAATCTYTVHAAGTGLTKRRLRVVRGAVPRLVWFRHHNATIDMNKGVVNLRVRGLGYNRTVLVCVVRQTDLGLGMWTLHVFRFILAMDMSVLGKEGSCRFTHTCVLAERGI